MFYIFWARFVWWAFEVCSIFAEEVIPGEEGWIRKVAVGILSGETSILEGAGTILEGEVSILEGVGKILGSEVMVRGGAAWILGGEMGIPSGLLSWVTLAMLLQGGIIGRVARSFGSVRA